MRKTRVWIFIPLVLFIVYLMGPRPSAPRYDRALPELPGASGELETFIRDKESKHTLRPDNEARIVWADSITREKTEYAILYLHGFSASQGEGDPLHRNLARKFGSNLFLSRLAEHGIDTTEQLVNLTADALWESAKEAFSIASRIGEKVIIVGTSTGGTLALMLAAAYPEVHSLVLLSPNIEIFDKNAWLLNNPWGLQIADLVTGSRYVYASDTRPVYKQYWNYGYRMEAVVALEEMLETSMKSSLFKKVTQPVLMLYYYRDEVHQDSVVRVDAMHKMFASLGTPEHRKQSRAMPQAGNHVLGSWIKSNDVEGVEQAVEQFMQEVLHMNTNTLGARE